MLYKIEHLIYPIDVYIHIGKDLKETLSQFKDLTSNLECNDNWNTCDGCVFHHIVHIESNRHAVICAFENIPNNGLIVHEVMHTLQRVYEHIQQTNFSDENTAYIIEYLFNEVDKAIIQYKNDDNENQI